ncbi:hypothetical protein B0H13DRAFT_2170004 [Mycena leptocephala]|nr:hypothetical protein B0H13DRAFT_2170004 [Mycena leptocephala]
MMSGPGAETREQEPRKNAGELAAPVSTSSAPHPGSAALAHLHPYESALQHRAIFPQPVSTPDGAVSSDTLKRQDDSYVSDGRLTSPMPTPETNPRILLSSAPSAQKFFRCSPPLRQGVITDLHCHRYKPCLVPFVLHAPPDACPSCQDSCNCDNSTPTPAPHAACPATVPATVSQIAPTAVLTPGASPVPARDLGNVDDAGNFNAGLKLADPKEVSDGGGIRVALTDFEVAKAIYSAFGALGIPTVIPMPLQPHPASYAAGHASHALPRGASPPQNPSNRHHFPPSTPSAIPLQPPFSHPTSSAAGRVSHALHRGASPRHTPSNRHNFPQSPLQSLFSRPASSAAGRVSHALPRGVSPRRNPSNHSNFHPLQPLLSHPTSSAAGLVSNALSRGASIRQNASNHYTSPSASLDSSSMPHPANTPSYDDFFASIRKPVFSYPGAGTARST